MKTFTTLKNLAGSIGQNTSTDNLTLIGQLINDQHRYLIQKYFDNERTATIQTVGGFTLTVTSAPALGATSATLSSVWTYPTCTQLVTFSDSEQIPVLFTYNSTALTWTNPLVGTRFNTTANIAAAATSATLSSAWAYSTGARVTQFSDGEQKTVTYTLNSTAITWSGGLSAAVQSYLNTSINTTSLSTVGVQDYAIPANISKIKDGTINVGQLKYTPTEIKTQIDWDRINFLPYNSDIPNYYFIYNGRFKIFPVPSTTGNIITFNYKTRVPDLTYTDYTAGNINTAGMAIGSVTVTGLSTNWITTGTFPSGVDLTFQNLYIKADPPNGDGIWYPINSFTSGTVLTLNLPVINAPNITNTTTYTIGQMPLLSEDFHDMLVFGALMVYYSSIVSDTDKFKKYEGLYNQRLELLKDYAGTKSVNVDLGLEPAMVNPNLFLYGTT